MMSCPSETELRGLLAGEWTADNAVAFSTHLDHCDRCSKLIDELQQADPVAALIQGRSSEDLQLPGASELAARAKELPHYLETRGAGSGPASSMPPTQELPTGVEAFGQFRLVRQLGSGGMGIVWEAVETSLERSVALKLIKPEYSSDPTNRSRFLREAKAAAAVTSDHIVPIYHVGEIDGTPYLAMQLLRGQSLYRWLENGRQVTLAQALHIAREAAKGLAAAHAAGLVHRDVKPANLWLEAPKGRVRLLDFGLARPVAGGSQTQPGLIVGTPGYLSPEQCRGVVLTDRCDIFALGIILYELLTGQPPFSGNDTVALLLSVAIENPKPVAELNPNVPAALAKLVERMLAKEPTQRPSAEQVIEAIRQIEKSLRTSGAELPMPARPAANTETRRQVETRPEDRPARLRKKSKPKPPDRRWLYAGTLSAVLIAALSVAWMLWPKPQVAVAPTTPQAATPTAMASPSIAVAKGTLKLFIPGPPVPVAVLQEGKEVAATLATPQGGTLELPPGTYQLQLPPRDAHLETHGPNGPTRSITIEAGKTAIIQIRDKNRPGPDHRPPFREGDRPGLPPGGRPQRDGPPPNGPPPETTSP